jgi:hypothetical protein
VTFPVSRMVKMSTKVNEGIFVTCNGSICSGYVVNKLCEFGTRSLKSCKSL